MRRRGAIPVSLGDQSLQPTVVGLSSQDAEPTREAAAMWGLGP
jgi:hypothetical protein